MLGNIPLIEVAPQDQFNQMLPTVIYYHGWQINSRLVLTQGRKLASQGFRVILPDAQSHGRRHTEVSQIPSLTFLNSIYTNLFEFGFIVDSYQRQNKTDDRIGVGGLSMGGMTTCALLTHNPQIKAAACLMGTPQLTVYRNQMEHHIRNSDYYIPEDFLTLTTWVEDYDLSRQPEVIGDMPLFFWHGSNDRKVPFNLTEEFVHENPDLNLQWVFDESGHLVNTHIMDLTTEFFVKNLF